MKVIYHARVPIIKAVVSSDGGGDGSGDNINFNIDISVDGPAHSGLATSAFTSYLSDHLPNLAPLTIVLKSLLQVMYAFTELIINAVSMSDIYRSSLPVTRKTLFLAIHI